MADESVTLTEKVAFGDAELFEVRAGQSIEAALEHISNSLDAADELLTDLVCGADKTSGARAWAIQQLVVTAKACCEAMERGMLVAKNSSC